MAKGRNFNDIRGGVDLGSRQVVSQWKGMLVVRSIPIFQSTEQWSTPWEVRKQAIFSDSIASMVRRPDRVTTCEVGGECKDARQCIQSG